MKYEFHKGDSVRFNLQAIIAGGAESLYLDWMSRHNMDITKPFTFLYESKRWGHKMATVSGLFF